MKIMLTREKFFLLREKRLFFDYPKRERERNVIFINTIDFLSAYCLKRINLIIVLNEK